MKADPSSLESKKNFDNTKRRLKAVRTIDPNHPSALIFLGRLHMLEGNRLEAIEVFSEQQKLFGLSDILTKELDNAEIRLEELD